MDYRLAILEKNPLTGKRVLPFLAVWPALVLLAAFCSCRKEKPTKAIITVIDSAYSTPVSGATVRLQLDSLQAASGTTVVTPDPKVTDNKGQAEFVLENIAYYIAEVTKPPSPDTAEGFVRFEEGKTVEVTILF